jgi:MoaA/NifB/PqqE/SkfB family radical SAM enzyme
LADSKDLELMGVKRIVLSGGEPLLHPEINSIVSHYSKIVQEVVLISNGWLATEQRLLELQSSGLTGVAFSLDSSDPLILFSNRDMSELQIEKSLSNFEKISKSRIEGKIMLELGVISVITSQNCSVEAVSGLLTWALENRLDYVKFNQIFDDGYVGKNAPHLMLNEEHAPMIEEIEDKIIEFSNLIPTNPPHFWSTVAKTLRGSKLDGGSCGIAENNAILYHGKYNFCAWMEDHHIGEIGNVTKESISKAKLEFPAKASKCNTGPHCHCLQNFDQKWGVIE